MKIAIAGAAGRMGQMLIQQIGRTEGCSLGSALESPGSKALGSETAGKKIVADAAAAIGTTGLNPEQTAEIHACAKKVPILWAANMSMGINILQALVEKTAALLDPSYDIEVLEMHHRHKIDAPSGTALALGRSAAAGRKVKLEQVWRKSRDGHTGARPAGEIGFATLRGGEEVGVHTVMFAAAGERLELSHRAFSRETYAAGAVRAALWLQGKKPGLYDMKDVLGL
jgi:4-hydroxy-tetrahydrodipicolinate reductase